jgi:hypothetical protein
MKSSDCLNSLERSQAFDKLMAAHDARRAVTVDWKRTPIAIGEFALDNPLHQLARSREPRVSNGRSYMRDFACGKACGIKDHSDAGPHRSFGTMSSQYPELNAR